MDDLLLHPRTKAELTALLHDAPHALLLVAPTGTGKYTLAKAWAAKLAKKADISVIEPDEKGTITIEATRALYTRTRAKQDGHQVIIIDNAQTMSGEAQNAFLKLLEEPRASLTFILTATSPEDLLPTILSRLQIVHVLPVGAAALSNYAKKVAKIDDQTLVQLLFIADGRPATLVAMAQDPAVFDRHKHIMQRAKQLVGASQYERLSLVQELSKDKADLITMLEALARMIALQLQREPAPRWVTAADAVQTCLMRLRQNGNPRAQLVHLFLAY